MGRFGRSERGPAKRSRAEIHSPSGELAPPVRSVERRPGEPAHLRGSYDSSLKSYSFAWACTQVMAMTPTMSSAEQPREEIVHRSGDALSDGAVGLRLCKALHQLVADVSGVQIGEYEDVRLPRHRGAGGLRLAHRGYDGGIQLQLAVQQQGRGQAMGFSRGLGSPYSHRRFWQNHEKNGKAVPPWALCP